MFQFIQKIKSAKLHPNFVGGLWMIGAVTCFLTSFATVKFAGEKLPSIQIVFIRSIFQMLIMLPIMIKIGFRTMKSKQIKNYFFRLIFGTTNIILTFYAFTHLEFAPATAIVYTRPLFTIILAAIMLHENVGLKRGIATVIGFLGILIVLDLKPGQMSLSLPEMAALAASFFLALTYLFIQKLSRTENHCAMLMWFGIACFTLTAYPASLVWVPFGLKTLGVVFCIAATATSAQYCIIRAYQVGKATVISPLDYLQIPLSAFVGFCFFGEHASWHFAIGSLIIIATSVYILKRRAGD